MAARGLTLLCAAAAFAFAGETAGEERVPSYRYSGVVRAKSVGDRMITVETRHGFLDFFYPPAAQKQCSDLKGLKVGDAVQVVSPTGRAPYEASCVNRVTLATEPR